MSVLLRPISQAQRQAVLGLVLLGLLAVPGASAGAQLDTVSATGTAEIAGPVMGEYANVTINASSSTSGQDPSGNASFTLAFPRASLTLSGPVTCLHVFGPDRGGGTAGVPTTAVLTFQDITAPEIPFVSVTLVDNGGNGADTISSQPFADCTQPFTNLTAPFTSGRAVVFDAPVLPTSKDQCKNAGWRSFPQFKNQGQCVSFVETGN